ncbi:3-keto-disaccharide hydrolase [Foetidibacter luteolus]|uniref:3-keto-disaccharide hydrolase n=1 Tax=Foetidibacter luteolus TaxID=2608880 RepID=UPI00129A946F|nr:DUF1080 domain-containing protein [Foetidibacter luteolus]
MKRLLLFILVSLTLSFYSRPGGTTLKQPEKWVSLLNGKDLTGWTPKITGYAAGENFGNTFRIEDGLLKIRYDAYGSFNKRFGALHYNRKLTSYRLRVEYRFTGDTIAGAPVWGFKDGGIQYYGQSLESMGVDQPFPVSLEFNLHGGNGSQERPTGEVCANGIYFFMNGSRNTSYCTLPVVQKTFHGGEWITAEIDIHDGKITHYINGEEIISFNNPMYDTAHAITKTLVKGPDYAVKDGYLSIQSNSHPMDFRKIEIMEY